MRWALRAIGTLAVLGLPLMAVGGCDDRCEDIVLEKRISPDGRHAAVLFQRACGATTGLSTQIAVLGPEARDPELKLIFSTDDNHGVASAAAWGGPWAEARWLAPDHLLVSYDAKSRNFGMVDQVAGVRISYGPVDR